MTLSTYAPRASLHIGKGFWSLLLLVLLLTSCGGAKSVRTLSVGDPAPNFSLTSADGKEVSLSDFRGKIGVLLYFNMAAG